MTATSEVTACRDKRRARPIGYADWSPRADTRDLLRDVDDVLEQYEDHLPLTIRQVFYALVAAGRIDKTETSYNRLSEHLNRARRARLIPMQALRDDGVSVIEQDAYTGVEDFHEATALRAGTYVRDRQAAQPYRIELWAEAGGMMPQLSAVTSAYGVPVYSAGGFVSLSGLHQIAARALRSARPLIVLHVGDLDPSGESIFDRIAADARAFVLQDRTTTAPDLIARRVALTRDQVAEHQLPTAPTKELDSRAKRWQGTTCQLEALPPDTLAEIVTNAITSSMDMEIFDSILGEERDDRAELLGLPPGDTSG